ncbi:PREDICTED: uncharacterized protein LOC104803927 [Tarenaya hassleriana]|uniref:uncharacterized protein LOC104803927 n=1 Tax=Tarenaya hassleriana TaxID=28532 RepID=UPI00053C9629|nr:PREDICTED: uncharacterized protein LOC104803927 [Tarenaya hassleriana]
MRPPRSLKEEFLKKWQMGLELWRSSGRNTAVADRRKAIKVTADIAMASLRKGTTCWSRALIAKTANSNNYLVRRILSSIQAEGLINKKLPNKTVCHKKILRRSKKATKRSSSSPSSSSSLRRRGNAASKIAKGLVKRKTQGLRNLIPGGELMNNEILLVRETLDYITSLQTQVDVMRSLVDATEAEMSCK